MYRHRNEVCHSHVTLSKVCKLHKFDTSANDMFDTLKGDLVHSSRVAQGPEAKFNLQVKRYHFPTY